ncbi:GAL4-like Zn(II)2Cys6 (or C6 zinc) binuclear cluster DNA-binding domain [Teratosphaeria destructans]|uniref:GAL4-like Zn(II)2Cys6 (Or C6 zinc) binuclear cluster DNA-binding domain n=1 Tax=Teratosphaeria destructans TaxID=418781 RepID=A0A9W7SKM2_9PEZI|nr:GAL4-like Zn(II)2Cys6 (or C6 zinc) binuclear cluster DNA-binding domain [Teratosphaeria destructans]
MPYACLGEWIRRPYPFSADQLASERKKSHDKVYPKGYVEMLEQQQGQLVSGLQEMYRRLIEAKAWEGGALAETNGNPLTHDILSALNLLETKHDGSGELEPFEEDCEKLQSKLLAEGAGYVQRRGSFSSDSDHSQHGQQRAPRRLSPPVAKPSMFRDGFNFGGSAGSTPLTRSPVPQSRPSSTFHQPPAHPSPMPQSTPLTNPDPQFYRAEWAPPDMATPEHMMRPKFAMQSPDIPQNLGSFNEAYESGAYFDTSNFGGLPITSYPQQHLHSAYGTSMPMQQDWLGVETMDLEFSKYIQPLEVAT